MRNYLKYAIKKLMEDYDLELDEDFYIVGVRDCGLRVKFRFTERTVLSEGPGPSDTEIFLESELRRSENKRLLGKLIEGLADIEKICPPELY